MWDNLPLGVARSCLTGSVFIVGGGGGGGNETFELEVCMGCTPAACALLAVL
jgi:hypothetical protein